MWGWTGRSTVTVLLWHRSAYAMDYKFYNERRDFIHTLKVSATLSYARALLWKCHNFWSHSGLRNRQTIPFWLPVVHIWADVYQSPDAFSAPHIRLSGALKPHRHAGGYIEEQNTRCVPLLIPNSGYGRRRNITCGALSIGTKKHWSLSWRNYWVLMVTALQLISPDYLI